MLTLKEINKIRAMYYDSHCTVTFIARRLQVSKGTVYKYLKYYDFSPTLKTSVRHRLLDPYRDTIITWLEEDRRHPRKQRHTGKRVYDRLKESFPDFNVSYYTTNLYFKELRTQVFQSHNGYIPLTHAAGECQADIGDCTYFLNGVKHKGHYFVMTFPYSNASYCQLMLGKNAECILTAMQAVFDYIGGVPHIMWLDNDVALCKVSRDDVVKRSLCEVFMRFKLHYDLNPIFCSLGRGYEKGSVEAGIRYCRKNLLVPVPAFEDMHEYNRLLLERSVALHERNHYLADVSISDLHFDDLNELNPLPRAPFEICSIYKRKLDNMGRLYIDNRNSYFISPEYAYKSIQLKLTAETVEIFSVHGELIHSTNRLYGHGLRHINYPPYIRLLVSKPNALNNFSVKAFLGEEWYAEFCKLDRKAQVDFLKGLVK